MSANFKLLAPELQRQLSERFKELTFDSDFCLSPRQWHAFILNEAYLVIVFNRTSETCIEINIRVVLRDGTVIPI